MRSLRWFVGSGGLLIGLMGLRRGLWRRGDGGGRGLMGGMGGLLRKCVFGVCLICFVLGQEGVERRGEDMLMRLK